MESFNNLNNEFIKSIDNIAINNYPLEKPLKNTLKTIVKSNDFIHIGTNAIYNKKMLIDISRSYDNLAQMFIKVVLSTGNVASLVQPGLGFKIFKSIKLMTKRGTTLQYLTPEYQLMRSDELNGTPLFDYIENAITENVNFVDGDVTVNRAVKDYKMLKNAKTERELFFKCNSAFQMLLKQLISPHDVLNTNYIYIDCFKDDVVLRENVFSCLCNSAIIQHYLLSDTKEAIKLFLTAAMTFPFRSGECYYNIYLLSGNTSYLKNAYENRYYKNSFLPINTDYYSNDKIGMIENEYNTMFPEEV